MSEQEDFAIEVAEREANTVKAIAMAVSERNMV